MGKTTISMAIFNSFLYVYQRVSTLFSYIIASTPMVQPISRNCSAPSWAVRCGPCRPSPWAAIWRRPCATRRNRDGSRVTMKKWWILLGFCWIDMGCWWIDMDFMIALDQYWDFTDDLYWFIGLWLGKYAFSVGELLLYWNTTPPCFVPCYSAAMASTAWWSCIWSPRCSLGWSYWWWKGHRPVRLWHAGAAPLTLQAGQASNWRHFGAVANFVSTLLINRHLPVVPHKAVAEVSKIGNL